MQLNLNGLHVMIDMETLGLRPGSVITEIGAVAFRIEQGRVTEREVDSRVWVLDVEDSLARGFVVDGGTLRWWLERGDPPVVPRGGGMAVAAALAEFHRWGELVTSPDNRGAVAYVWGNGASFDLALLAEAYARVGMRPWWRFTRERCFRTFAAMFHDVEEWDGRAAKHGALEDARCQVAHVARVLEGLEGAVGSGESGDR